MLLLVCVCVCEGVGVFGKGEGRINARNVTPWRVLGTLPIYIL